MVRDGPNFGLLGKGLLAIVELTPIAVVQPKRFVVEDVAVEGFPSAIYGAGGMGKSYLAMLLAVCVAAGIPFLGKQVLQGNVAYVDYELDIGEQQRRLAQIAKGLEISWQAIEGRIFYESPELPIESLIADLIKEGRQQNVVLTIIDSIRYATALNLQDDQQVGQLVGRLRLLGSVVLIGHQPKAQGGKYRKTYGEETLFGSVFLWNACRSIWQVEKKAGAVTLRHRKHNFTPQRDDIKVGLQSSDSAVVFSTKVTRCAPKKRTAKDETLFTLRELGSATAQEIYYKLTETGVKISRGTVKKYLNEFIAAEKIIPIGKKGNAYIYSVTSKSKKVTKR